MVIAFDLDGTLIRLDHDFPLEEKPTGLMSLLFRQEALRRDTVLLFRKLQSEGHSIWIYTTSFRKTSYIRRLFSAYGISLQGIVNGGIHYEKITRDRAVSVSKFPPHFGIDLLIDDSHGIRMEGEIHGFNVLVIDPRDERWIEKILKEINK